MYACKYSFQWYNIYHLWSYRKIWVKNPLFLVKFGSNYQCWKKLKRIECKKPFNDYKKVYLALREKLRTLLFTMNSFWNSWTHKLEKYQLNRRNVSWPRKSFGPSKKKISISLTCIATAMAKQSLLTLIRRQYFRQRFRSESLLNGSGSYNAILRKNGSRSDFQEK